MPPEGVALIACWSKFGENNRVIPPLRRKHRPPPPSSTHLEPPIDPRTVRFWEDGYLHERLAKTLNEFPYGESVLRSELRIREAWRSPSTWALAVSVIALIVSFLALFRR